jgi:uncharacterized protein YgiM (DUF1202 family)
MLKVFTILTLLLLTLSVNVNAQSTRMARVISERANMRDTPSANGNIEQDVAEGTMVRVLGLQGAWYVVRDRDRVGWMHGNTLEFIKSGSTYDSPRRSVRSTSPTTSGSGRISTPRIPASSRMYIRGPRGGCYYLSGSGRKVYVDRSLCD